MCFGSQKIGGCHWKIKERLDQLYDQRLRRTKKTKIITNVCCRIWYDWRMFLKKYHGFWNNVTNTCLVYECFRVFWHRTLSRIVFKMQWFPRGHFTVRPAQKLTVIVFILTDDLWPCKNAQGTVVDDSVGF